MKKSRLFTLSSFAFFIGGSAWLAAPFLNNILRVGPNMISEYEAFGMPYGWLFRLADLLAAVLLFLLLFYRRKQIIAANHKMIVWALGLVGGLMAIDALTPLTCRVKDMICSPETSLIMIIHGAESYLLGLVFFGLTLYLAYKRRSQFWAPIVYVLCAVAGVLPLGVHDDIMFGLQAVSVLTALYAVWYLLLGDAVISQKFLPPFVSKIVALIVGGGAILSLLVSGHHFWHFGQGQALPFGEIGEMFVEHSLVSALVLLYLARALFLHSRRAWQIAVVVTGAEVIWHVLFGRSYVGLMLYLLIFIMLLVSQSVFYVYHDSQRLWQRLRKVLAIIAITAFGVTLYAIVFRYHSFRVWQKCAFTPLRVVNRVLLLEISSDRTDPIKARLFGYALNAAGLTMYGWTLAGLFLPYVIRERRSFDNQQVTSYLERFSTSSEDYFKLWPHDKKDLELKTTD